MGRLERRESCRLLLSVIACAAVLGSAAAGQVIPGAPRPVRPANGFPRGAQLFVVDRDPSACRFSAQIQPAVDAARDGDVILVEAGHRYETVFIDGKALTVICRRDSASEEAIVPYVYVSGDRPVVLRGLSSDRVRVQDHTGAVFIEDGRGDVSVENDPHAPSSVVGIARQAPAFASSALSVSGALFAYDSEFLGNYGDSALNDVIPWDSGSSCFDCISYYASNGGPGVSVTSGSSAHFAGCQLIGGPGGCEDVNSDCPFCPDLPGAQGGYGLIVSAAAQAFGRDTTALGGWSGQPWCGDFPGVAIGGPGAFDALPGQIGSYHADTPVVAGLPVGLHFSGPPGWNVALAYSETMAPHLDTERNGYSLLPPGAPVLALGTLPASGELHVSLPSAGLVPPGAMVAVLHTQARFYDPVAGQPYLGPPSTLVIPRSCP
jgi:hypothetical protein